MSAPTLCHETESYCAGKAFLASDYAANRVVLVDGDGRLLWQRAAQHPQEAWLLDNGHVLLCYQHGVQEVVADLSFQRLRKSDSTATDRTRVAWEFKTQAPNEIHSAFRRANGTTIVGLSAAAPRILEVGGQGQIIRQHPIVSKQTRVHAQMRGIRLTEQGTYLVGQNMSACVREYDAGTGRMVHEILLPGMQPYVARRLADGHLLVGTGDAHQVLELDAKAHVVWSVGENDITGCKLFFVAGVFRTPIGTTVICNYAGGKHGVGGTQPQVVEVTSDKRIVWQFNRYPEFQHFTTIQLVEVNRIKTGH